MTTTDWPATGAMLQGIGSILGPVAVAFAAWIGSRTFKSWRQQKLSERRIEQAERILTATYKVRRGLSRVRSIAMWGHEIDAAKEQLQENPLWKNHSEAEQKRAATAQAYYIRLNRTTEDRKALEECQPMARALFGEELEEAIEKLNQQFWTVQIYVDANQKVGDNANPELRAKIEGTIWEGWPKTEENEMDQIIAAQVKLIEDLCVPVLRLERSP